MTTRAVDEAAGRLRALRAEEREKLGLAALAITLALAATEVRPPLAVPLFVGGVVVGAWGVLAAWRRWDLVDRLSDDREAYAISEVVAYAARQATMHRRGCFAAAIRARAERQDECPDLVYELEALAAELEDDELALEPACAVACSRLLDELDGAASAAREDVRSRIARIRSGLRPAR